MAEVSKQGKQSRWFINPSFKGFATYLMILVFISLLLAGVKMTFTGSMVLYVQKNKPDFMQVFFPIGGVYSEDNSERTALFENHTNGVKITLPGTSIDHVRIDPANEATEVVISKVELRRLFSTEIYLPKDLLEHSKPIQMIDKMEVIPAGLLIRSTGIDPAFELQFKKSSGLFQFGVFGIISALLSLAVFLGVKKFAYLQIPVVNSKIYLLTIPLLISLGIAALFYPGFMSYDTLHALRSARNGVTDSMWPPMVSYVWRAVNLVSFNPSAMHFSQVFLLLFSIFFIVFFFTKKISYATAFLIIYLCIPVVLGTVAVIWKDVLMAAFFMAGFAVMLSMRQIKNKWGFTLLLLLAVFLTFLGVCSRHNAITGAAPLLFYLAWIVSSRLLKSPTKLWLGSVLLGTTLIGTVFLAKTQLDHYSLPGFVKMNSSTDSFIQSVRVLDVAGASLCVGSNLFGDIAPNLSLAEIKSGYDPRHVNLSTGLLDKVPGDSRINHVWMKVAVNHPICFLYNKFQLTKYMIGANRGVQFLITAPSVDKNEYGYSFKESSLRDLAVGYIIHASELTIFKPWLLYFMSTLAFVYMLRVRLLSPEYLTIYLSAFFYLAGLVLFGNAADARLPFYTTTALSMFTIISIFEFKKRRK